MAGKGPIILVRPLVDSPALKLQGRLRRGQSCQGVVTARTMYVWDTDRKMLRTFCRHSPALHRSVSVLQEMDTYRYHGHSMSDPGSTYRTRDEITGVRQVRQSRAKPPAVATACCLSSSRCERVCAHFTAPGSSSLCVPPQERDPVERLRKLCQELNLLTAEQIKAIEREQRSKVDKATAFATASPEPPAEALYKNIYQITHGADARGADRLGYMPLL